MRSGALDVGKLTTRRVPFANSLEAYGDLLGEDAANEVGVVLEYAASSDARLRGQQSVLPSIASPEDRPDSSLPRPALRLVAQHLHLDAPVTRLDAIGAGNFARTMLLPHLRGRVPLGTVVNNTGLSANHVKNKLGFAEAATDYGPLFADAANAAVLIATRHHLHAPLVKAALAAHRHVFVEKPLCLTPAELADIEAALAASRGSLQVGFNRRFSGAATQLQQLLRATPGPKTASYRVMAGALDPSSWYANYAESGGRIVGEACHFFDFLCFLFESSPVRVSAQSIWPAKGRLPYPDGMAAQVEFADGSCGQLVYSAEGDSSWPKEVCTVFGAGLTAEIHNFRRLVIHQRRRRTSRGFDGKGHAEQMSAWSSFLRAEGSHPLPFEQTRRSSLLVFAALESIQQGCGIELGRE
jgi:predicted dehydrogenase